MVVMCEQCGKSFGKPHKLKFHIDSVHLNIRKFKCEQCGESCVNRAKLQYHMYKHSDVRDFYCQDCGKSFKTRSDLYQHYEVHDKGKIFKCQECNEEFKKRGQLENHVKKHTKNIETTCKSCNKEFLNPTRLKNHVWNMHKKNPELPCPLCGKKYYTTSTLEKHIESHSTDSIPKGPEDAMKCSQCPRHFKSTANLNKHTLKAHQGATIDGLVCDYCDKHFQKKIGLTKHIVQHLKITRNFIANRVVKSFIPRKKVEIHEALDETFIKEEVTYLFDEVSEIKVESNPLMLPDELEIKEEENVEDTTIKEEYFDGVQQHLEPQVVLDEGEMKQEPISEMDVKIEFSLPSSRKPNIEKMNFINDFHEPSKLFIETSKKCCSICNEAFPLKKLLKSHMLKMHGKNHNCKLCDRVFLYKSQLEIHKKSSHEPRDQEFNCKVCVGSFATEEYLQRHVRRMHMSHLTSDQIYCFICFEKIPSRVELKKHTLKVHDKESKFDCDQCELCFMSTQALHHHKVNTHDVKNGKTTKRVGGKFPCLQCGVKYKYNSTLKLHIEAVHEKNSKHKCLICEEGFLTPYHVTKHVKKVHEGGLKLTRGCGVCKREFKIAHEFFDHIASHEGCFICRLCGENQTDKRSLDKHQKVHRKVDEKYKKIICDICGLRFGIRSHLLIHMHMHSDVKSYTCDQCGKNFRFPSALGLHKKIHDKKRECGFCKKLFATKTSLDLHERTHTGEKPYSCQLCGARFAAPGNYNYHMRKHNGTLQQHPCTICEKTFDSKFFLTSHILQQHSNSKEFSCSACHQEFKFLKQLQRHQETKCPGNATNVN